MDFSNPGKSSLFKSASGNVSERSILSSASLIALRKKILGNSFARGINRGQCIGKRRVFIDDFIDRMNHFHAVEPLPQLTARPNPLPERQLLLLAGVKNAENAKQAGLHHLKGKRRVAAVAGTGFRIK